MRSTSLLVLAAAAVVALGCGSGSGSTGTGGAGGTSGTGGSHGTGGSGGQGGAGGACAVCAAAGHATLCPSDVANASMCPSQGATCCDGNDVQWECGLCAAETCRWVKYCPATGTGGSSGQGGNGAAGQGAGGQGGSGAGGQGGSGETCAQLATDYGAAFVQARTCNASLSSAQCTHLVISSLTCDCQGWVNDTSLLDPILAQWNAAGCTSELCPAACLSPGTSGACTSIDSGDVCVAAN